MKYIFEVVDHADEETYWTLGVFLSLEEAIAALDECKAPSDLNSDGNPQEHAVVEVRQRKVGWSGIGTRVYVREWIELYDDDDGESKGWQVTSKHLAKEAV